MTESTEQQEVVTRPEAQGQDVFTTDPAATSLDTPAASTAPAYTDPDLTAPADPAEVAPVGSHPELDPDADVATHDSDTPEEDEPTADKAQAVADANSTATRETVNDEDLSIGQQVGAQIARARNALERLEETVARDVHAALAEIESLLGLGD
ncbi:MULTISPECIES: hypothetical protein [unclassified Achromobacter]|uniref:hypothetical protein n=1 Tax=unclassified Achromobacter TaxID=2626865 RepID=UPI000B51593C|nr:MULTISPECIES: hypothetical protein [unclassified Achromobacter]OWT68076.1 hypothetical protein CEY05_29010 [Achromobacter sp. HZ34]OWT69913.1 hypothetical protein CEY04_27840 [Achromobacter sp. HZ28]